MAPALYEIGADVYVLQNAASLPTRASTATPRRDRREKLSRTCSQDSGNKTPSPGRAGANRCPACGGRRGPRSPGGSR
eukprot:3401739-Pyramimonas_sp.AAC.1